MNLLNHQIPDHQKFNGGFYLSIKKLLQQKLRDFFLPHHQKLESDLQMTFNWENGR
ncbi:MAG: hypothetical protein F6K18_23705 [Okeania sp. SIO2C2]|nr:hypothetical protein [Okeania sp. SIO2C9]NEP89596.1 hypothetical protein [Okeania sp. SIO2C2]NEQ76229.1 hypothetical protein [Okeania sp. SIO2C9]